MEEEEGLSFPSSTAVEFGNGVRFVVVILCWLLYVCGSRLTPFHDNAIGFHMLNNDGLMNRKPLATTRSRC